MIRTQYSNDVLTALANLRTYAGRYPTMGLSEAINALDNAGVFADLDEQMDYASAESILAESAADDLAKAHDPAVCDTPEEFGPALHAGTCPAWATHHNLAGARQALVADALARDEAEPPVQD